jgi:hypothetical protein
MSDELKIPSSRQAGGTQIIKRNNYLEKVSGNVIEGRIPILQADDDPNLTVEGAEEFHCRATIKKERGDFVGTKQIDFKIPARNIIEAFAILPLRLDEEKTKAETEIEADLFKAQMSMPANMPPAGKPRTRVR